MSGTVDQKVGDADRGTEGGAGMTDMQAELLYKATVSQTKH